MYKARSRVQQLLLEDEEEENFGGAASSSEDDHVSEESEESDYEFEGSEDGLSSESAEDIEMEDATLEIKSEDACRKPITTMIKGKNGFIWHTHAPERRSDRHNIGEAKRIPGPKGAAESCMKSFEFWNLLFDEDMRKLIVEYTNLKIEDVCCMIATNEEPVQTYHHQTDLKEINAFIAILYYAGLWKSNKVNIGDLWSNKNGASFYRCVMSKARFTFLLSCLRFDDKTTRQKEDKLSPIRDLWAKFINNCTRYYKHSNWCTVDKQFIGSWGRSSFKKYMRSKPNKCITLNDAKTFYLISGIPYLGKTFVNTGEPVPEYFFREVTTPIHNTNTSVTCNNWFMSIPLLEKMKDEPYNIRITGTIRKNKREIPAEMKISGKEVPSTKFCFHDDLILLSHTPKKNKIVLVASSYLNTTEIDIDKKPNIILHYDATKYGSNSFDQLCHSYSVNRVTQRWPMRYFFAMLDQAQVNSRILYTCKWQNRKKLSAREHLRLLISHLCEPYLHERYLMRTLRISIRSSIAVILNLDNRVVSNNEERPRLQKKVRCAVCKDRKTALQCPSCIRPMCDEHRVYLCTDCGSTD